MLSKQGFNFRMQIAVGIFTFFMVFSIQLYVRMVSTILGPMAIFGPLTRVLIGDAQSNMVGGLPSRSAI